MQYRLMNEYDIAWPMWDEAGPCGEGVPALPPQLAKELLAWAGDFTANYSVEAGWPTERAARSHERQAKRLHELVERALAAEHDVVLHYWETNSRKGL